MSRVELWIHTEASIDMRHPRKYAVGTQRLVGLQCKHIYFDAEPWREQCQW